MKFSIIIPTQNRPELVAVVARHAMRLEPRDYAVIVSDNSTSPEHRQQNAEALREHAEKPNFRIIHPPRVLSAPEHFEFALDAATGDYVTYLTDKMVILPGVLTAVENAVRSSGAEIVNWAYAPFSVDDIHSPSGSGTLTEDSTFLDRQPETFDPRKELQFKASGEISRDQQNTREYALGKIIFGFYSRQLIDRIRAKTGTLFVGATHDYSAMVQGLSLANSGVMLNAYGVLFVTLPRDKSLGSLTATDSTWALRYFHAFSDSEGVMGNLLVPQVYASQHNMVAHDYVKFLPLYGNMSLFNAANWLRAISDDLNAKGRTWADAAEHEKQLAILGDYLKRTNQRPARWKHDRLSLGFRLRNRAIALMSAAMARLSGKPFRRQFSRRHFQSLDEAVEHLAAGYRHESQ